MEANAYWSPHDSHGKEGPCRTDAEKERSKDLHDAHTLAADYRTPAPPDLEPEAPRHWSARAKNAMDPLQEW
jgi:hypothetical protein